jgi:hypothetical protein
MSITFDMIETEFKDKDEFVYLKEVIHNLF